MQDRLQGTARFGRQDKRDRDLDREQGAEHPCKRTLPREPAEAEKERGVERVAHGIQPSRVSEGIDGARGALQDEKRRQPVEAVRLAHERSSTSTSTCFTYGGSSRRYSRSFGR